MRIPSVPAVLFGVITMGCGASTSGSDVGPDAATDAAIDGASEGGGDVPICRGGTAVPPARAEAAGGVDPMTGALWIGGGDVGPTVMCMTQPQFQSDVWRYEPECDRWTQRMIAGGPSARGRMAYALDAMHRRLLIFGGRFRAGASGTYTLYNEVWSLDLAAEQWTQVMPANTGPSARANATAVYDETSDELVVFGGNTSASGATFVPQNDVWALNLATMMWRRVMTTGTAPSVRLFHAAAIRGRTMLVFGGGGANAFIGPFYSDLYTLDLAGSTWTRLAPTGARTLGRINAGMVADAMMDRFFLVAGHDDGQLGNRNDVFSIATDGTIAALAPGDSLGTAGAGFCDFPADFTTADMNAAERRSSFVIGVDAMRRRAIIFGGRTDCGSANDVWSIDLATGEWRPLRLTNEGQSCARSGRSGCTTLCT